MDIKFNLKRRIVFNGKEYGSPEELPENVREAYEKAMEAENQNQISPGVHVNFSFNGKKYPSVEAMPPEERKLYEDAMALVGKEQGKPQGPLPPAREISSPDAAPITPGGAPAANNKLLILLVLGAGLVLLFILLKVLTAR